MPAFILLCVQLISGLAIAFVFSSTGLLLLRLFKTECSPIECYLFGFGLGTAAWGILIFLLAAASVLYPSVITGLLAVAVIAAVLTRRILPPLSLPRIVTLSWTERLLLAFLLLHVLFSWMLTFLPPWDQDGVAYHLSVPKIFLANHGFKYLPFILHSNWPSLSEMTYAAGLAVFPDGILSVQMHFFAGLACAAILFELGKPFLRSLSARLIVVLSFVTLDAVRHQLHMAFSDLFTAMYVLLSWMVALRIQRRQTASEFALLGIFIGCAASTKLTAPVYCFSIPFLAIAPIISSGRVRDLTAKVIMAGALSILIVLPWYVKSWLFTGNPFWPFGYTLFGGRYLDAEYAAKIASWFGRFLPLRGITGFLLLPIEMVKGDLYAGSPVSLAVAACMGILTVPWIWKEYSRSLRLTTAFILWGSLVWFLTSQQVRFLIPFLGLLILPVVFQCERMIHVSGWKKYVGYAMGIMLFLQIIYRVPLTNTSDYRALAVAVGISRRDEHLRTFEPYNVSMFLNTTMQEGDRVALIGELRGFYIDKEYTWTGFNSTLYFDLNRYSADMIESKLRQEGISHIVLRLDAKERELEEPARDAIDNILAKSESVYADRWYAVYRLHAQ